MGRFFSLMVFAAGIWAGAALAPAVGRTQSVQQNAGTEIAQSGACHPSYIGVCLPVNGPDVDCAGGRGNGPLYAAGPFRVVGPDPYRLDRDRNGIACERG